MPADDPLYDCQPHTCSAEFTLAVQPLEYTEQLIAIFHVKPCAIIAYIIDVFLPGVLAPYFNDGTLLPGRELDRVGKQVDPDLTDQR